MSKPYLTTVYCRRCKTKCITEITALEPRRLRLQCQACGTQFSLPRYRWFDIGTAVK